MARAQVFNPAKDNRSDALRRAREAAERRKAAEEVAAAIKAQALARDPANAGVSMQETDRRDLMYYAKMHRISLEAMRRINTEALAFAKEHKLSMDGEQIAEFICDKAEKEPVVDWEGVTLRDAIVIEMHPGTTKVKRAERRGTGVFEALAATLAQGERDAGNDLVEIYARRFGKGGQQTDETGFIDKSRPDGGGFTADMESAGRDWRRIMGAFGCMSVAPLLLDKLCQDAVYNEGSWRPHVRLLYGVKNHDRQAAVVKTICAELHAIMTGNRPY